MTVALSREQYEWMKQVIENWRETKKTLREMQVLSRRVLFEALPNTPVHKHRTDKGLGFE